jgi:hypothetical protein
VSGIVEPIPGYMWGCGGVEGNPHLKHACPPAVLGIETGTVSATLHAAHANLRAGYEEAMA